ncbi:MAG: Rpn family recombination-promoting nuclease/putative transposase [Burkholderiaceae bacterium]|nr:Rpn family recombination-promoting nuclease/putative transposase [Burkholderiaceae bacterium]
MASSNNDASYKLLFSCPELVRDLVMGFIPDDWLHSLDYSTLEQVSGNYVTDDLRHRADDVVWRVKAGDQWVYLYILMEFQSKVDPWMAVRVMTYVGLLYQDLIRKNHILPNKQLPPVLPIVLYNGDSKWTAATDIAALIPGVPGLVSKFLPKMEYLLIAENQYTETGLAEMKNLFAAMMRLQRPPEQASVLQLIDLLTVWLKDNPELLRVFAIWIRALIVRQSKHTLALPKIQDMKELKMTLAARFEEWAHQYEQKGKQEGKREGITEGEAKGEAKLLQRLLVRRFGPLPHHIVDQLSKASTVQIEAWGDRVLDAKQLDEIFTD